MDLRRESSQDRKKDKKKKHDRSHSHDKKKKKQKDRDASREHKKKDKEKKHHKDRDRSRSKNRRDRSKEPERDREQERPREKEGQRRQKQRQREKDYQRPRQREGQRRDRQRDAQRDRKQRSRDKQKSKEKKRKDYRSRSRSKKKKNDRERRANSRQDKYEKWRRERDAFRFDSPPKSDQSDISDDPEKMDRLNKMKAEKELVSSKADRKLYLGNLPPNITSNQLMQMLNAALKKMEINTQEEGDSIISAWVSPDGVGHYAFVEFRSAHQATAGLALNGASLYGYQLKLGRPKQYIEYQKQLLNEFGSDSNIDTILKKFEAMGGFIEPPAIEQRIVYPPSKVIVLKHIVTIQELAIDEEYQQIMQDISEMAKRFGDVIRIVIPRPMEIDLEEVKKRVKGLGYVFIKYKSIDQARYARRQFIKQMFSDRSVACGYFPQKKFDQGELDVIDRVVIQF